MQIVISTFFDTLYFKNKKEPICQYDVQKIKEFQKNGNLFGIIVYHNKECISCLLEKYGLCPDFYVHYNGRIENSEQIDCFRYELMTAKELKDVLTSIKDEYQGVAFNGQLRDRLDFNESLHLHYDEYNLIVLKFYSHNAARMNEEIILNKYGNIVQTIVQDNELTICSKKAYFENCLDDLIEKYPVNSSQVHIIKNNFFDLNLVEHFHQLYAINQSYFIDDNIVEISCVGEGISQIMHKNKEDLSLFLFLKKKFIEKNYGKAYMWNNKKYSKIKTFTI